MKEIKSQISCGISFICVFVFIVFFCVCLFFLHVVIMVRFYYIIIIFLCNIYLIILIVTAAGRPSYYVACLDREHRSYLARQRS